MFYSMHMSDSPSFGHDCPKLKEFCLKYGENDQAKAIIDFQKEERVEYTREGNTAKIEHFGEIMDFGKFSSKLTFDKEKGITIEIESEHERDALVIFAVKDFNKAVKDALISGGKKLSKLIKGMSQDKADYFKELSEKLIRVNKSYPMIVSTILIDDRFKAVFKYIRLNNEKNKNALVKLVQNEKIVAYINSNDDLSVIARLLDKQEIVAYINSNVDLSVIARLLENKKVVAYISGSDNLSVIVSLLKNTKVVDYINRNNDLSVIARLLDKEQICNFLFYQPKESNLLYNFILSSQIQSSFKENSEKIIKVKALKMI